MRTLVAGLAAAASVSAGVVAAAVPAQAALPPACRGALIQVSHSRTDGATGHGNVVLVFRNISQRACTLRGYPGVDALGRHGGVLAHARRTVSGFTGGATGVHTLVLQSWHNASADLEWRNFTNAGGSCAVSSSLAITPPNTTTTVHRTLAISTCDLQIHPVVYGTTGNSH